MNSQSRAFNSIRNLILGIIGNLFFVFLNFIAKTVFIRILGNKYLGINGLFTDIFLILSFAEFGIGSVMVYSLYEPIAKDDKEKIIAIYKLFKKIYIVMSTSITLIGLLIIPTLKFMVNTKESMTNLTLYYILFLASIHITNMNTYKSHLIIADQKKYIVWVYQFLYDSITQILQIIFLILTGNYIVYLMAVIGKNLVYNFSITRKVNKLYPFIKEKVVSNKIDEKEKLGIIKRIKEVFIYKFSGALLAGTDNIIISILVGIVEVGYYSNYNLIITAVLSLVATFDEAISASVGNFIVNENVENQYRIFNTTQVVNYWITGTTTTCLFILFKDFITLWIGKEYLFDWKIEGVILLNYYLMCIRNPVKTFRDASGMFEKVKNIMVLAAIINIVLSILMGLALGVFGILLATAITTLSTYYWYEAKLLMESRFGSSIKIYLKGQLKSLSLTIISILLTYLCVSMIHDVTVINFIIKIIICIIVPNIFYFIALQGEEEFKVILMKIVKDFKISKINM